MNDQQQVQLYELFLKLVEGTILPFEKDQLDACLIADPQAVRLYHEFVMSYVWMINKNSICTSAQNALTSIARERLWDALAEHELTAPTIDVPITEPKPELIRKVVHQKLPYQFPTTSVVTALVSMAAFLMMIAYVYFVDPKPTSVGTLRRTVNAQWGQNSVTYHEGETLYPGLLFLQEGCVEILCDNGATVILEGPAEFSIENPHQLFLQYGRLVARVDSALEKDVFVVRSPYSCVVDYGTEFGVKVDASGLETAVFEGQVDVREGTDPVKFAHSVLLNAGEGAVARVNQAVRKAVVNADQFIGEDTFDIRYQAAGGSKYAQWKFYAEQLDQDSSLIAHYIFESDSKYPDMLVNTAAGAAKSTFGLLSEEGQNAPMWTQGRWPVKKAMQFDRKAGHRIRIPADPALCISGPITLGVWMKLNPTDGSLGGHILSCREENGVNYQLAYFIEYDSGSGTNHYRIQFLRREMESKESHVSSDEVVLDTQKWHFLAVTHDTQQVRYYLDGKLLCQMPFVYSNQMILDDLYIGDVMVKKTDFSDRRFHGILDEIMIFERVLTPDEIKSMYLSGNP